MNTDHANNGFVCIEAALVTHELSSRPARIPGYQAESQAMKALAREMAGDVQGVLRKLTELVTELCHADSAAICIAEPGGEQGVLRWHAVTGSLAATPGGIVPREGSPCATVIARNSILLCNEAEHCYPALRSVEPHVFENLSVPWTMNGQAIGAVWAISHSPGKRFDSEDARLLQSLASFAAMACQMVDSLQEVRTGKQELERRVKESARMLSRNKEELQREVMQRRKADQALHESRETMQAALSIETVGILFFNLDGTMVDANPAFERMSGYTKEELCTGGHWDRLTPPEFMEITAMAAGQLASTGRTAPYEKQLVRKDGKRWWGLCAPTRIAGRGEASKCVEFILDITESKEAEAVLRESEARFRTLTDASPALVWQCDVEGKAVFVNQRCVDFTGKPREELLHSGWQSVLHPDDIGRYAEAKTIAIRERQALRERLRMLSKDGAWHWFEAHALPFHSQSDDSIGLVGISIDITDAVRSEETLKAADRAKDEFLAVLAHELRNPLAPLSNATHLLKHQDGRKKADRLAGMIERQVVQLVRLVDDLLEISRITSGKIELRESAVDLGYVLQSAIETCRPLLDDAGHRLTVSLPDEPVILHGDNIRLTQIFSNIINNAAKYTKPGGEIAVVVHRDEERVAVSVKDNGAGIQAELLPHVFDSFVQAGHLIRRDQNSLGIGLTLVRRLVEMHGGTVEARSEGAGCGSEFIVRLSAVQQAQSGAQVMNAACEHPPLLKRVLVVDDNHDAADSLALLLEFLGAETHVVNDGKAALEEIMRFRPELVLLDIGMPGMNGYEVARHIRALPEFRHVCLVALTGWGQEEDRRKTAASGFDDHLTKPADIDALKAILESS